MSTKQRYPVPQSTPAAAPADPATATTSALKNQVEQAVKAYDLAAARITQLEGELELISERNATLIEDLVCAEAERDSEYKEWVKAARSALEAVDIAVSKGRMNRGSGMDKMFDGLRSLVGR